MPRSVIQDWMSELPLMQQSTLLLSLRGPDTHRSPETKKVQRWMRGLVFVPGNPANVHEFMTHIDDVPEMVEKGPLARELEFASQHFYSHLIHGLEVLAYRHPRDEVCTKAWQLMRGMCEAFHLLPETREAFEHRLRDREWPVLPPKEYTDVGRLSERCPK